MARKSIDFKKFLIEKLKDPRLAVAYLNEHFRYQGSDRQKHLLLGIKNVIEAQGFTVLSRKSGISRRTLYKAFSETGNPTVETLFALLDTIGVSIRFENEHFKNRKNFPT
ncbi:MAG: helix-turn-helix domain-containing transcriptional regulator [Nitrospiria bacterium]